MYGGYWHSSQCCWSSASVFMPQREFGEVAGKANHFFSTSWVMFCHFEKLQCQRQQSIWVTKTMVCIFRSVIHVVYAGMPFLISSSRWVLPARVQIEICTAWNVYVFHCFTLFLLYISVMAWYWFLFGIKKGVLLGIIQNIDDKKNLMALIGKEWLPYRICCQVRTTCILSFTAFH